MNEHKKLSRKSRSKETLVSVVMPIYNASLYLKYAIESILSQTYQNIELILIDDASSDNSLEILKWYKAHYPRKVVLLRNKTRLGISSTMNRGIAKAKGKFIARMDADDMALPTRLEKQINHLMNNPTVVAVGSQCVLIDKNGSVIGKKTFPTQHKYIYSSIFEFTPLQQSTIMIAKERIPVDFEFYHNDNGISGETELLFKLFAHGKVENLTEALHLCRIHDENMFSQDVRKTFAFTLVARINGVYLYNYRPSIRGIVISLIEALMVFLLPQSTILKLYNSTRRVVVKKAPVVVHPERVSTKLLLSRT